MDASTTERPTTPVQNPVLRGFNPDPSILRVGQEYYIATSTFEWWPGVQIWHSRDLRHWRLATRPLDRLSLLDLRGNTDSGGIWAPCLTFDGERFHLIYTDVKAWGISAPFKDSHNYLTTAEQIEGPWSEPVYLNSSGFDPSLFHDDDGRKWLLNMVWDHRKGKNPFGGIVIQEYDPAAKKLVGEIRTIFTGTDLKVTEGSHLYRHGGWYHLLVAEGGTSYAHAVTMARARDLFGPYQVHPQNPVLTAHGHPELPIQKAGHASLTDTPGGEWIMAHLCGRPITPLGDCPLGRETALQAVEWGPDGWLRLRGGSNAPKAAAELPALPDHPWPPVPDRDDFDAPALRSEWQTLRVPAGPDWLSLSERPGWLRLRGRESLQSTHCQSLVGRRLESLHAEATTRLEFAPTNFQQMAGLACYYNTNNWAYLRLSRDETLGRTLNLLTCDNGVYDEPLGQELSVKDWPEVHLRVWYAGATFVFSASPDGHDWQELGPPLDAGRLSDEHCGGLSFTGTFLALCCQDLSGQGLHADFDFFEYRELGEG